MPQRRDRGGDKDVDELLQQYINPNVAVAEVRPQDLAPVPADPSGTRALVTELLESFELTTPRESERIEEIASSIAELKRELQIKRDLANMITGTVVSKQTIYLPAIIGYSRQIWADYKVCSSEHVQLVKRNLDVLRHEIRELLMLYVHKKSVSAEADVEEVKKQLVTKLTLLFQLLNMSIDLFVQILYRLMAVRSLDLPPQYRSSLANIQMLRIDFLVGRRFSMSATEKTT